MDRQSGLDAHAKRQLDPQKYEIAAAGCAIQFRRVYIAKVEKGWLSLSWHQYSSTMKTEDALRESTIDHALPREFNGALPYVDRGAEYHGVKRLYISHDLVLKGEA